MVVLIGRWSVYRGETLHTQTPVVCIDKGWSPNTGSPNGMLTAHAGIEHYTSKLLNDKVKANMYSYTTLKCDAYVIPLRPKAKGISYSDVSYSMWQWSVHKETDLLTTIGMHTKETSCHRRVHNETDMTIEVPTEHHYTS